MALFEFGKKKGKDEYNSIFNKPRNGHSHLDKEYSRVDSCTDDGQDINAPDTMAGIRGTITSGDCPYCHATNSMEYNGKDFFFCPKCNCGLPEDEYYNWYLGGPFELDFENGDFPYDHTVYSDVYTEEGETVRCLSCGAEIKWKDETYQYICPNCEEIMGRTDLFNHIGADPPGLECATCNNLYPGCISCPYGYVDDDDF